MVEELPLGVDQCGVASLARVHHLVHHVQEVRAEVDEDRILIWIVPAPAMRVFDASHRTRGVEVDGVSVALRP